MVCEINGLPPFPSVKDALEEPSIMTNDELEENEETTPEENRDIDFIYDNIVGGGDLKDFGQWLILLALIAVSFLSSWPVYINLFAGYKPRHRCLIPNCDNESITAIFSPDWISTSIPANGLSTGDTCQVEMMKMDEQYDPCHKYQTIDEYTCNAESFNFSTIENCNSYVYDNSVIIESFVTKFDLVCEKEHWNRVLRGIMVFGLFIGSVIGGRLGDQYGRKTVMLYCSIAIIPNTMFAGYSPNLWMYSILLLINTTIIPMIWISIGTLVLELFGRKSRSVAYVTEGISWSFGAIFSVFVFYLTRHWKYLHIWIGVISILILPAFFIIPESPRWLVVQSKRKSAEEVLLKIARRNGKEVTDHDLEDIRNVLENVERNTRIDPVEKTSLTTLLAKQQLKKTLTLTFYWGILCTSYYVLHLNVTELSGNVFLNSILLALLGNFPGKFSVGITLKQFPRRYNIFAYHFLAGTFFVILGLIPKHFTNAVMIFYLLSMICIEAGYTCIGLITRELYPTNIRNQVAGIFSALSRLFAICSPFISKLSCIWKPLPALIIGISFICVSGLSYNLAETKNINLADTNHDQGEERKFVSTRTKTEQVSLDDNEI